MHTQHTTARPKCARTYQHTAALTLILFLLPQFASATLRINEVAWMGTHTSASDEWIELYNGCPDPIDLAGWTLTDGEDLTIELSGEVAPGEYIVLERTDDDSAPGAAHLTYTGALGNDGATLTLTRPTDEIEHEVSGGANWETLGGDNETKATAQLTDLGWITATATPGSENATTPQDESSSTEDETGESADTDEEDNESTADTNTVNENDDDDDPNESISLSLPDTELALDVHAPAIAHAGRPVMFDVTPSGITDALVDSLNYTWNFGDGATSSTQSPTHTYRFSGSRIVVVEASYARHDARERKTIEVLPLDLALEMVRTKGIGITNETDAPVDLAGMVISDGAATFTFPARTIVPAAGTLTLAASRIGLIPGRTIALTNTDGTLVARTPTPHSDVSDVARPNVGRATSDKSVREDASSDLQGTTDATQTPTTTTQAAAVAAAAESSSDTSSGIPLPLSLLALLGIVATALLTLITIGRATSDKLSDVARPH